MAFLKNANAVVVNPNVGIAGGWSKTRTASGTASQNLVAQATEILGEPFDPSKYLLTHCTIVASVDVETVPGVKLGKLRNKRSNRRVYRKYSDYHITPNTSMYVNNNGDCWSRATLLKSFDTFIGAHNFQEHIQIEEQSKGRIIDACARDIGNSIYVDILVATDRKHEHLVKDIRNGKLGTLSMGCTVDFTVCSQCGNVAVDETELCDHIKYHKLDTFYDRTGKRRIIAELCGHPTVEPTAGVTFIEASWVAQPAFTGAVMRNILEMDQLSPEMQRQAAEIMSIPSQWVVDENARRKAASFGDTEEEAAPVEEAPPPSLLDDLEDEIEEVVVNKVKDSIKEQIRMDDFSDAVQPLSTEPNDTLQKEARLRAAYDAAATKVVQTASSDAGLVNSVAELDVAFGRLFPRGLYRASLRVGASSQYPTLGSFLEACTAAMDRPVTPQEAKKMLRLGKFLSVLESTQPLQAKETRDV